MIACLLPPDGWDIEPSIVAGCAGLLVLYGWGSARAWPGWARMLSFWAGVLVLLLDLISPLDTLSDEYLFSAHMVQHLVLVLIVPPLLIWGLPRGWVEGWLQAPESGSGRPGPHWRGGLAACHRRLSTPWLAWTLATVTMWFWHVPWFYNLALAHEGVHVVQHLMFLVTGTIFWWPVFSPLAGDRLGLGASVGYLFAAAASNTALGIALTFAPVGLYPLYMHPPQGAWLTLVRQTWGLSAAADQQLGGLIMWVPGCAVYFAVILGKILLWHSQPDHTGIPELEGGRL